MEKHSFEYYIERYIDGTITADEWAILSRMAELPENTPFLHELMDRQILASTSLPDAFPVVTRRILSAVEEKMDNPVSVAVKRPAHRIHFLHRRGWAAASIILLLATGTYFWITGNKNAPPVTVAAATGDIVPGREGAVLTLADGRQVVLDSLAGGVIAIQQGSEVVLKDGRLAYDPAGETAGEITYNTMTTPNGRQFRLQLPDGTGVWLNAASSIRYPTVFTGTERKVELTGEAYFEVAKNAKMPFRVKVNGNAEVEVLGTHFNVNAYENEETINTTLLEGSVKVNNEVVLQAGQQAQVLNVRGRSAGEKPLQDEGGGKIRPGIKVISKADIDKVMAWKNGLFNFNGASLQEVMKQLERWYDIEVVYEKNVPDISFGGEMTKGVSLSGVLIALERSEVHFRIEGRKLIVLP